MKFTTEAASSQQGEQGSASYSGDTTLPRWRCRKVPHHSVAFCAGHMEIHIIALWRTKAGHQYHARHLLTTMADAVGTCCSILCVA